MENDDQVQCPECGSQDVEVDELEGYDDCIECNSCGFNSNLGE